MAKGEPAAHGGRGSRTVTGGPQYSYGGSRMTVRGGPAAQGGEGQQQPGNGRRASQ